jgi:MerR HTH family regulatory protein
MAVEVDFITLGDASARLDVPSPTLRHWTDQLEDLDVHYVMRNNRNERIYYDTDLEIFAYLRDLKSEHGRRTTTKDLAYMMLEMDRFRMRTKEEVPLPSQPSNKTTDLLNQKDIKQLLDSDRVKQLMSVVVDQTTKNLKEDLLKSVREEVNQEMMQYNRQIVESHEKIERELKEREERWEERAKKRDDMLVKSMRETIEAKKPWWKKMFGE